MTVRIDIIILSFAKTELLKQTTINGIDSLLLSENPAEVKFEILVMESNKQLFPYQYPGTRTIYPQEEFGFNKYLNMGISQTSNDYLCLCNNDLVYHQKWATEIISAMTADPSIQSANPYCDRFNYEQRIKEGPDVIFRHKNRGIDGIFTGWCLMMKRTVFDVIGQLDEQFSFWYADNDLDHTLNQHQLAHALVKRSRVTHLVSQSHETLLDKHEEMTTGQRNKFANKWLKKSLLRRLLSLKLSYLK